MRAKICWMGRATTVGYRHPTTHSRFGRFAPVPFGICRLAAGVQTGRLRCCAQELHVPTPFASSCSMWPANSCSARAAVSRRAQLALLRWLSGTTATGKVRPGRSSTPWRAGAWPPTGSRQLSPNAGGARFPPPAARTGLPCGSGAHGPSGQRRLATSALRGLAAGPVANAGTLGEMSQPLQVEECRGGWEDRVADRGDSGRLGPKCLALEREVLMTRAVQELKERIASGAA